VRGDIDIRELPSGGDSLQAISTAVRARTAASEAEPAQRAG
jgi:hypothetical protein